MNEKNEEYKNLGICCGGGGENRCLQFQIKLLNLLELEIIPAANDSQPN